MVVRISYLDDPVVQTWELSPGMGIPLCRNDGGRVRVTGEKGSLVMTLLPFRALQVEPKELLFLADLWYRVPYIDPSSLLEDRKHVPGKTRANSGEEVCLVAGERVLLRGL